MINGNDQYAPKHMPLMGLGKTLTALQNATE